MSKYFLIITTVPDEETAKAISRTLVDERLAACVSLSSSCQSTYRWQGKVSLEREYMLFIKTQAGLYPELEKRLAAIHPYDVPEIIAVPLANGYGKYLAWIKDETDPGKQEGSR